jgi:hypothetical protein
MKLLTLRSCAAVLLCLCTAVAHAELNLGVGLKAGTLGAGVEAQWRPLPYIDLRVGANMYEFDDSGSQAGINYDATLNLESFYGTLNLRFPMTPLRFTAGAYSNSNELLLVSQDTILIDVGNASYPSAAVGTLTSTTSFPGVSPYVGIGLDFSLFSRVGLYLDFGVLWQGEPDVTLTADGVLAGDPGFQASLEQERLELFTEFSDFKAWPVASLGFFVKF